MGEDSVERHLGERCIDADAAAEAEASVRKYEVANDNQGGDNASDNEEEDEELARAFKDASLNLNINR